MTEQDGLKSDFNVRKIEKNEWDLLFYYFESNRANNHVQFWAGPEPGLNFYAYFIPDTKF